LVSILLCQRKEMLTLGLRSNESKRRRAGSQSQTQLHHKRMTQR
jgi:hypothetical protein